VEAIGEAIGCGGDSYGGRAGEGLIEDINPRGEVAKNL